MVLTQVILLAVMAITLFGLFLGLNMRLNAIQRGFLSYFTRENPDKPSEFEITVNQIADVFNEKLKASVKGSLMGSLSAVKRNDQKIQSSINKAMLAEAGTIGKLVDYLPDDIKQAALDNPDLAMQVIKWVSSNIGGDRVLSAPRNGDGGATDFKLGV